MCGEHLRTRLQAFNLRGSSPRVWGTCRMCSSLTPPQLGSSPRVWGTCGGGETPRAGRTVHPHVCGEHSIRRPHNRPRMTVHPHVCGEHESRVSELRADARFIPTCVGNIMCNGRRWGKNIGSSPRVWGTCEAVRHLLHGRRFIPTCVGNMRADR